MNHRHFISIISSLFLTTVLYAGEPEKPSTTNWPDYIAPLQPLGNEMAKLMDDADDPVMRLEMYRMLYMGIASAYMSMIHADAENPSFWPVWNPTFNWFAPSPDDAYYVAHIEASGTYQISGTRGTVKIADFAIGSDSFISKGEGKLQKYLASYSADSLTISEDGTFSVLLSSEKPKNYKGDWWHLDKQAKHILVRQRAYDWVNEVDGRFYIERLDKPANKPRLSAEELDAQLKHIPEFVESWVRFSLNWINNIRDRGLINKVAVHNLVGVNIGGGKTQQYIEGLFDLAPDEALIYETDVPDQCLFWNLEITNMLWYTIDYANRQSSLNGFTAQLDSDGKFRAVIAMEDPGVPNWLDTGGYSKGELFGRWTACDSNPVPVLTKVKLKSLREHLPVDTPSVSAEEREAAIRLRKKGAQMRRRW